jgi:hypothetical protein
MPISASKMTVNDVLQRNRERRREILKTLKPELLAEYLRLGKFNQWLKAEQSDGSPVGVIPAKGFLDTPRIPLLEHKRKLMNFLQIRGPARRREILKTTGIPPGSLGSLLKGQEFVSIQHGFWELRKK